MHQIADLLAQGADAAELKADYPRLTPAMLSAAPIYARARARRGRPKVPPWRTSEATKGAKQRGT